jgi:hypothetical protein
LYLSTNAHNVANASDGLGLNVKFREKLSLCIADVGCSQYGSFISKTDL